MSSAKQWTILLLLYVAQGLPFGFFVQAMPAIMREQGVEHRYIGYMSLLALPWALKFLWAGWVDRSQLLGIGHRKGWILATNTVAVVSVALLALAPMDWWLGQGIAVFLIMILLLNLSASVQDISTDALAVETIPAERRGIANTVQVGGYRIGMVIGGGAILAWLPAAGWQWSMFAMACILFVASASVLFWGQERAPVSKEGSFKSFKGLMVQPGFGLWVAFLLLYKAGDAFGTAMIKPMMIDLGYTLNDVAWMMGTWGVSAGLVGAVLGGLLVAPLGRYRALLLFAVMQTASLALYALGGLDSFSKDGLLAVIVIEHVTGGMATIALFTVMMDRCRSTHAGVDYSFQACLIVIATILLGSVSGLSVEFMGYAAHFMIASALTFAAVIWLLLGGPSVVRQLEKRHENA